MCMSCWEDKYGRAAIVNERTRAVAALIDQIYSWSCAGGLAHVVVDDWNLNDYNVAFCLDAVGRAERGEPQKWGEVVQDSPDELAATRAALEALRDLPEEERASAMAIHEGWIGQEES
jgi:hypothetical protein